MKVSKSKSPKSSKKRIEKNSKRGSKRDSKEDPKKNLKKEFKKDLTKRIKKDRKGSEKDSGKDSKIEDKNYTKKEFKKKSSKLKGGEVKKSFKPKSKFFKHHHKKGKFSEAKRKKIIEKMKLAEKYKDENPNRKPFEEPTPEEQHEAIRQNYDILLPEQAGYLIPDKNESTYQISQHEIVEQVDITSATKHFNLNLNFGPYTVKYYRNGRQTLLAGRRGHIATMDWMTKKLLCEFNAMESIHDVCWLHMPTLFAAAQKDWVHIYDDNGTEIHCLKKLYKVIKMEFLPYHFLMVTASDQGFLSWTDTSYGKLIAHFRPKKVKRITSLVQNPGNGIVISGHSNGVVSMWSPNSQEPAAQMLCHPGAIRDVAVAHDGLKMVTLGVDRTFKLWDVRKFQLMRSYALKSIGECVDVSQKDCLSIGMGNVVEVFRDSWNKVIDAPYLRHKCDSFVQNVKFCPFEDVLGIGHQNGFSSILVPGSGEPNFDAFESNPFMTNSQRREMEVKQLLEKIQPELISLDPTMLGKVNMDHLKKTREEKFKKYPRPQVKKKGPKPSKLFKFSSLSEYMPSQ